MFASDRSAFAVLLPIALLMAVVLWSNRDRPANPVGAEQAIDRQTIDSRADREFVAAEAARPDQALAAASLPSR
jgi:hypothetical protein